MTLDTLQMTRRHAMAAAAATGLALATGSARAQAPSGTETARGTVLGESGGTRQPLAGVMVSNGQDVVLTDAAGRWSLPITPGESVFVIKPTGWKLPVDPATHLPAFAYAYAPTGTPGGEAFRFAGLAPTGRLPESIDFVLTRQEEPGRFDALLFTDPQPESLAEVGFIRDAVVAQASGIDAAFGITHGDVMFDDLSYYDRYNRIVGSIGVPWYNCCGNHDMNYEAADNTLSRETFKRVYGVRWHAFQHGGATFFILDDVDYLGTDPKGEDGAGKYRGRFGERQLAFIRNVLGHVPRESLVAFSFHIPLRTQQGDAASLIATDARTFLETISSHPNSVSFSGHTHTNEHWYLGAEDGFSGGTHHHHVLAAVSGSWWSGPFDERGIPVALESDGSPNGFHVLSVDGTRYTTRLVPANDPNRGQMRIVLDNQLHAGRRGPIRDAHQGTLLRGPIDRETVASTRVLVNFFDGGPRSKLEMAVGDQEFGAMRRVPRTDPFVVDVYTRNAATKKSWVEPGKSTHVWQARLPTDLPAGTHRITVRATDEYGRPHVAWMVLEVVG
ncbi:Cna protein B-type domain containing protein [Rhodovastum atsumiense]|uniref:Cna protein B-type domain containing protein n=1 Tax=Rhodovastum atsumiense TaxID=504468 RepID=A0A5M6J2Y6_9PROT|nr:calcineurin-like phosphoesterase family protein [Rhodovastum atsumiense]KAA5614599.1 Cna protein B-type domain containing protein [Rhodovastum atsumiense]CAH2599904.1 Cna protein B-type domain containing protein [Rhodovastum atsumiense]